MNTDTTHDCSGTQHCAQADAGDLAPTIHVEPDTASLLDWYAAKEAAAHRQIGELPPPIYGGEALRGTGFEPDALHAADMRQAIRAQQHRRNQNPIKKPARVPRDTEPCSLGYLAVWVVAIVGLLIGASVGFQWLADVLGQMAGYRGAL